MTMFRIYFLLIDRNSNNLYQIYTNENHIEGSTDAIYSDIYDSSGEAEYFTELFRSYEHNKMKVYENSNAATMQYISPDKNSVIISIIDDEDVFNQLNEQVLEDIIGYYSNKPSNLISLKVIDYFTFIDSINTLELIEGSNFLIGEMGPAHADFSNNKEYNLEIPSGAGLGFLTIAEVAGLTLSIVGLALELNKLIKKHKEKEQILSILKNSNLSRTIKNQKVEVVKHCINYGDLNMVMNGCIKVGEQDYQYYNFSISDFYSDNPKVKIKQN